MSQEGGGEQTGWSRWVVGDRGEEDGWMEGILVKILMRERVAVGRSGEGGLSGWVGGIFLVGFQIFLGF
jgi:hypothetical protein